MRMGVVKCSGHLESDSRHTVPVVLRQRRQRCRRQVAIACIPQLVQDLVEPDATDVLHDDVVIVILSAHPEHRHDVRVVQPGGQARFPLKTLKLRRLEQRLFRQNLNGARGGSSDSCIAS